MYIYIYCYRCVEIHTHIHNCITDGQGHGAGTIAVVDAVVAGSPAPRSCKSARTGSLCMLVRLMFVCKSACGKHGGMHVRRSACPCVWTTLTPTLAHLIIVVVGFDKTHGLGRVLFVGRGLVVFSGRGCVLSFALRAITSVHTHTHTPTRTRL